MPWTSGKGTPSAPRTLVQSRVLGLALSLSLISPRTWNETPEGVMILIFTRLPSTSSVTSTLRSAPALATHRPWKRARSAVDDLSAAEAEREVVAHNKRANSERLIDPILK